MVAAQTGPSTFWRLSSCLVAGREEESVAYGNRSGLVSSDVIREKSQSASALNTAVLLT
jgi:hypothetical protein